ncbi:MAG TPA: head GIN domain-containing protein [Parafilimonas sp.]|nr:head GIN domain-containing protein [Parafilimonas sp.]
MKKGIVLSLATMICTAAIAQDKKTIEPSGNIITKEIAVKPFDAIRAEGLYEMIITQGTNESVKVEADDNVQNLFVVRNNGNTLVIEMPELKDKNVDFKDKNEHHSLKWKVYVSCKNLKSLDVAVIGNVRSGNAIKSSAFEIESKSVGNIDLELTAEKLTIENKGVGNLTLHGSATNAVVNNSGVGQFEGDNLVVQTMNIDNSGVGGANVNVQKDLKIKQSFLGKVRNKGNAKTHEMDGVEM